MRNQTLPTTLSLSLSLSLSLAVLVVAGCSDSAPPTTNVTIDEPSGPPLTEFELIDASGDDFRSEQLLGKVWIGSYFFTRCAANCRQLNMEISRLQDEFGPRGVQFVSITCDPAYDTPQELATYAEMLNAKDEYWTFLTGGDFKYIRQVGHDFLDVSIEERAHYAMLTIVDRSGKPRGSFHALKEFDMRRAKLLLEELLEEPPVDDPAAKES
ncbi:SCO family protein [Pirellulales bacterium]|nr:SCO family protein [Pirellulales bacterium]